MATWFHKIFFAAVLAVIPAVAEIPEGVEECEDQAVQLSQLRAKKSSVEGGETPGDANETGDLGLSDDQRLEIFLAAQADYNDTEMPTLHSSAHHGIRHSGNIKTLYHQTSTWAGYQILRNGFRRGRIGFCGGGIYFAMSPQATYGKAVGVDSKHGFIIEARVDLGKVHYKSRSCTTSMSCWGRPLQQTIQCLDRGFHGGHWSSEGYDSIFFNPGDGGEYMIWDKNRVLSMRRI